MTRLDLDRIDADVAAENLRERDRHREPGPRRPRRDDRYLAPRREFTAGLLSKHASASIEVPCPIPDCGSIVYVPGDSDKERIDCTDCGATFVTRTGLGGEMTLEVFDGEVDTAVVDDPDGPAPPITAGAHLAAFDLGAVDEDGSEPDDDAPTALFPLGGWQRRTCDAINRSMAPRSKKP